MSEAKKAISNDVRVDQERMSFGDHLDELRKRIFYALIGVVVAVIACFYFAQDIVTWLCQPLVLALSMADLNPRLYQEQVAQLFLNYMEMAVLAGLILASPWIIYQIWKFVAAGLYERERKFIKVFGAASLGLFLAGAAFVYFLVLPFAMRYFVEFTDYFQPPDPHFMTPVQKLLYHDHRRPAATPTTTAPDSARLPVCVNPPQPPADGQMWIDATTGQLQFYFDGKVRALPPISDALVAPWFNLADYISFAISLMFVFGLGFQMPLVILFLAKTGIVPTDALRRKRRVVILIIVILAAVITPTADLISLLSLALPMWGLFELGLMLGRRTERAAAARNAVGQT